MGNAYHVISDLHRHYTNKANRVDYTNEVKYVDEVIERQLKRYEEMGYKNYLIYLGDIFDISMRSSESSMKFLSGAQKQIKMASGAFSVVGNHEFTYYASNPFWFLMKEIHSRNVNAYRNGKFKAKGSVDNLIVPDRIVDGDVEFIFNHYGCGVQSPNPDKVSIGLFHQDVFFKGVLEDAMRNNRDVFVPEQSDRMNSKVSRFGYVGDTDLLGGYKRCFLGHNHLLYGDWFDADRDLMISYLGSLGRTAVNEVIDSFLERNIPTVIVKDGKLERVDDNKFQLLPRSQCVDELKVEESRKKYEKQKDKNRIKRQDIIDSNPVESVKTFFNDPIINMVVDEVIGHKEDSFIDAVYQRYKEI